MGGPAAQMFQQISATPYGKGQSDAAFSRPFNNTDETVIVRVRNLSALRPRRVYTDHIGMWRGGEKYAYEQQQKGRQVNLDLLYAQAMRGGRDVNPTEDVISPIDAILTFDGKPYMVVAKDEKGKPAPWCDVPEGVLDLYFGNWKRLQDPRERAHELERVRARRRDFCVRTLNVAIDDLAKSGEEAADRDNPFAFLVFDRKVVEPISVAVDMERVYAGKAMEV